MFVLLLLDYGCGLPHRASIIEPIAKLFRNLKFPKIRLCGRLEEETAKQSSIATPSRIAPYSTS